MKKYSLIILIMFLSFLIMIPNQNFSAKNNLNSIEELSVIVYSNDSIGSGFFINNGVVLTASHVVRENATIKLYDGSEYEMIELLYRDEFKDLAIFRVDYISEYVNMCYNYDIGDSIYTYSNPLGIQGVLTDGIISKDDIMIDNKEMILFSATISAGSSGGMLLNESNDVIGVIVAQMDGDNNNLAMPVNNIEEYYITVGQEE